MLWLSSSITSRPTDGDSDAGDDDVIVSTPAVANVTSTASPYVDVARGVAPLMLLWPRRNDLLDSTDVVLTVDAVAAASVEGPCVCWPQMCRFAGTVRYRGGPGALAMVVVVVVMVVVLLLLMLMEGLE